MQLRIGGACLDLLRLQQRLEQIGQRLRCSCITLLGRQHPVVALACQAHGRFIANLHLDQHNLCRPSFQLGQPGLASFILRLPVTL